MHASLVRNGFANATLQANPALLTQDPVAETGLCIGVMQWWTSLQI